MAPGLAAALLRDVAMRGDVLIAAAPLGPSALRRLAAATLYLADVLSTRPLAAQSAEARAEHVISALSAA
eukprot:5512738-Pleurochrysis_carterae.AAC.1